MKIDEVFCIFFIQQNGNRQPKRLIVFYDKATTQPTLAYEFTVQNRLPREYTILGPIYITNIQYIDFIKDFKALGILQPKGRAVPDGQK